MHCLSATPISPVSFLDECETMGYTELCWLVIWRHSVQVPVLCVPNGCMKAVWLWLSRRGHSAPLAWCDVLLGCICYLYC